MINVFKILSIILLFQFRVCELLTFTSEENYINEHLSLEYEAQIEAFEGSGVYFVKMITRGYIKTQKIMLVKQRV